MYIELLRGILNSNLGVEEKLEKISGIVSKAEEIENLALDYAAKREKYNANGIIEPTWDDRLNAIKDLRRKKGRNASGLDRRELESAMTEGIGFLKRTVIDHSSWAAGKEQIIPFIQKEEPTESVRPLRMLFEAPWEISLCISTFYDWVKSVRPDDGEALELISEGNRYLRKVQLYQGNGGVGDSFWIDGMQPRDFETTGNTLETAMAIATWVMECVESPSDDLFQGIEAAIDFLGCTWNGKDDGGWGFKPSWRSDVKSTAMVVMVLITMLIRLQPPAARARQLWDMSRSGLSWILTHQNKDGSWEYPSRSRDSRIAGSFYAIQTMTLALFYLESQKKGEAQKLKSQMQAARWKALRWYELTHKFIGGERDGWGWCDGDHPSSAVEETAASLIVLLDTGMLSESSPIAEQAMKWLLSVRKEDRFWDTETAIVIKAAIRMLHKAARLKEKLSRRSTPQEASPPVRGVG